MFKSFCLSSRALRFALLIMLLLPISIYASTTSAGDDPIPIVLEPSPYNPENPQIRREYQPVIMNISYYDSTECYVGHMVIADACKDHYQITRLMYRRLKPTPLNDPMEIPYEFDTREDPKLLSRYLGINWGWNGDGMMTEGSTTWFSTDIFEWQVGGETYTRVDDVYYDFCELTE